MPSGRVIRYKNGHNSTDEIFESVNYSYFRTWKLVLLFQGRNYAICVSTSGREKHRRQCINQDKGFLTRKSKKKIMQYYFCKRALRFSQLQFVTFEAPETAFCFLFKTFFAVWIFSQKISFLCCFCYHRERLKYTDQVRNALSAD